MHGLATIQEETEIALGLGQRQAFLEGRLPGGPLSKLGLRQRLEQQGFHLPAPAARASRELFTLRRKSQGGLRPPGNKTDARLVEESGSKRQTRETFTHRQRIWQ